MKKSGTDPLISREPHTAMLKKALREFEAINRQDPRSQRIGRVSHPREWIFSQKVSAWMERLNPNATEAARLAALSHTIRRWEIPRKRFPMSTAGYHEWRAATANHSAKWAGEVLRRAGYGDQTIGEVQNLITRKVPQSDPDAQLLEDADCLAFLEIKLDQYLSEWDDKKMERILHGTWRKMSPKAREAAMTLPLDPRIKDTLGRF